MCIPPSVSPTPETERRWRPCPGRDHDGPCPSPAAGRSRPGVTAAAQERLRPNAPAAPARSRPGVTPTPGRLARRLPWPSAALPALARSGWLRRHGSCHGVSELAPVHNKKEKFGLRRGSNGSVTREFQGISDSQMDCGHPRKKRRLIEAAAPKLGLQRPPCVLSL